MCGDGHGVGNLVPRFSEEVVMPDLLPGIALQGRRFLLVGGCLLYTSDAADE